MVHFDNLVVITGISFYRSAKNLAEIVKQMCVATDRLIRNTQVHNCKSLAITQYCLTTLLYLIYSQKYYMENQTLLYSIRTCI